MTNAALIQQSVYLGSERSEDNVHRGPSTAGWNDYLLAVWGRLSYFEELAMGITTETL
jgi:hypothetical protein